jgi:hypothetical protein
MKRTRCKMHSLCDMRCNNTHGAQFIACNSERSTWEYAASCGMPHVLQGIATAAILRRRSRGCCMLHVACWDLAWWDLAWWDVAWCASLAAAAGPHGSADRGADACEAFDGAGHRPSCEHSVRHHGHCPAGPQSNPDSACPSGLAVHERCPSVAL